MKRTFIFLLSIFLTLSSLAQIPYQYIGVNNNRVIARGQFNADSALILPGVSVVNYKAPGMLRYDASDSSVYVYSGFNWIKVGPGAGGSSYSFTYPLQLNTSTVSLDTTKWHSFPFYNTQYRPITWVPTLQEVTTAGNTTTDSIVLKRSTTSYISLSNINIGGPVYGGIINVYRDGGFKLYLKNTEVGVDYNNNRARLIFPVSGIDYSLSVPDTSLGSPYFTIPTIIRVNGSNYTSSNGGLVDLGTITTDISGKLNISDTSAMLSPYLPSNVAAATYQPIGSYLTTGTLTDSLNANGVTGITLNTPNVIFSTPVTFSKTGRSWSGTLSLNNQSANTVFAGPTTGSAAAPTFRTLVDADIPDLPQYRKNQDTIPLAVFNMGSGASGDVSAFTTSAIAGSFYLDGTDTFYITSYRVVLQGSSPSITPDVWFNSSLSTSGATKLVTSPAAITNTTTGTSVSINNNKIAPGNFVFVSFGTVTTAPTYFSLTLFGYRIREKW
mgnify:CR=1 FL=1